MVQYLKRMDMNEYTEPPDGEVAELVTLVRVYGNRGGWRKEHWEKGEVGVDIPRGPGFRLDEPGEFHHYPKERVFIVSPQKNPEDLEQMLADAYLDNPDLKRLHLYEATIRGILYELQIQDLHPDNKLMHCIRFAECALAGKTP